MSSLRLNSFRLQNFKAVQDSGEVRFTPLTVFIGNNGSGKSSLIEGLKTFYDLVGDDVEDVMREWHGYESIWYRGVERDIVTPKERGIRRERYSDSTAFALRGRYEHGWYSAQMEIGLAPKGDELFISNEKINLGKNVRFSRDARGNIKHAGKAPADMGSLRILRQVSMEDGVSFIGDTPYLDSIVADWQFLYLDPKGMGEPSHQYRTSSSVDLNQDGSNIAEYLMDIRKKDSSAFEGIVETLRYVLPYASGLQTELVVTALDRQIYLQMKESKFEVPGWLLSTGTLRFVAILALLRHPNPPGLIVIEEIENGLDPRTLSLIIDEIRTALEEGKTQVIATTHSPHLLDLLDLSQIVLVERTEGGQPTFSRPADQPSLKDWAERFSPGRLYTMDLLHDELNK
jgi:predicted ATPase